MLPACTYYIMQAIHNVNKNTHIKWDNVESMERIDDMKKEKIAFWL